MEIKVVLVNVSWCTEIQYLTPTTSGVYFGSHFSPHSAASKAGCMAEGHGGGVAAPLMTSSKQRAVKGGTRKGANTLLGHTMETSLF